MSIESLQGTSLAYQGSAQTKVSSQPEVTSSASAGDANRQSQDGVVITNQVQQMGGSNNSVNNSKEPEENTQQQNNQIKRAVSDINKSAKNTEAVFGIHDGTNRVTIKIVDRDTKKVIKEYPPEKTLDMIQKVWEMAGLMVDERR